MSIDNHVRAFLDSELPTAKHLRPNLERYEQEQAELAAVRGFASGMRVLAVSLSLHRRIAEDPVRAIAELHDELRDVRQHLVF